MVVKVVRNYAIELQRYLRGKGLECEQYSNFAQWWVGDGTNILGYLENDNDSVVWTVPSDLWVSKVKKICEDFNGVEVSKGSTPKPVEQVGELLLRQAETSLQKYPDPSPEMIIKVLIGEVLGWFKQNQVKDEPEYEPFAGVDVVIVIGNPNLRCWGEYCKMIHSNSRSHEFKRGFFNDHIEDSCSKCGTRTRKIYD